MKCAIMQPTYLPWSGYFNLIASVDHFVFLNNVQYERRSWQSRNRIMVSGAEHILTVPVERCPQKTLLDKVLISYAEDWRSRHWLTLKSAYGKSRYANEMLSLLEPHLCGTLERNLACFTEMIIRDIVQALAITTKLHRATTLPANGMRSERLASLCRSLSCDSYISPEGSRQYLEEDNFQERFGIKLHYQEYNPSPYAQMGDKPFVTHLSIVDVIANLGLDGVKAYIKETNGNS